MPAHWSFNTAKDPGQRASNQIVKVQYKDGQLQWPQLCLVLLCLMISRKKTPRICRISYDFLLEAQLPIDKLDTISQGHWSLHHTETLHLQTTDIHYICALKFTDHKTIFSLTLEVLPTMPQTGPDVTMMRFGWLSQNKGSHSRNQSPLPSVYSSLGSLWFGSHPFHCVAQRFFF